MTVPSEQSRIQYQTDGVSVSFPVPFRFIEAQHLRVTRQHGDAASMLTLGSDYTVSGANNPAGGTLTTLVAYPAGDALSIERIVPVTQETAYQRNDPFPERAHEQALDKLTMICQMLAGLLGLTPGSQNRALLLGAADLDGTGSYRANSNRIQDVGNAVAMHDAINKKVLLDYLAGLSVDGSGQFVVERLADADDPANGAGMVARTEICLDHIAHLLSFAAHAKSTSIYRTKSFHAGMSMGGGVYMFDPSRPASDHDGGLVIAAAKPWPESWPSAEWYEPATGGAGCFVLLGDSVTATQFGAMPGWDNTTKTGPDNAIALNSWAGALTKGVEIVLENHTYYSSRRVLLPVINRSKITVLGDFVSGITTGAFLDVRPLDSYAFNVEIKGINATTINGYDWHDQIGLRLSNLYSSIIDVRYLTGFEQNMYCVGEGQDGFASNAVYLGGMRNGKNGLGLRSNGNGWCNENTFYGGSFMFGSDIPESEKPNCVHIRTSNGVTTNNNNMFFRPHFEANSVDWVAASIEGESNVIMYPRMEGANRVRFESASTQCRLVSSFTTIEANITDLGWLNQIDTDGFVFRKGSNPAHGIVRAENRADSNAPAFAAVYGGVVGTRISADGVKIGATEAGIYAGAAAPNGTVTAARGSLYLRTAGDGSIPSLYGKFSGNGNTGWSPFLF